MTWGESTALAPAGPQATRLAHVYWTFFGVCAVVYVVVLVLLVVALSRRSEGATDEARRLRYVTAGGAVTATILLVLLAVTARAGHGLNPLRDAKDVLVVQVVARQWCALRAALQHAARGG
ncbi:MAG TPA: hypothetical protein VIU64_12580 [Polyangia bacterium]